MEIWSIFVSPESGIQDSSHDFFIFPRWKLYGLIGPGRKLGCVCVKRGDPNPYP